MKLGSLSRAAAKVAKAREGLEPSWHCPEPKQSRHGPETELRRGWNRAEKGWNIADKGEKQSFGGAETELTHDWNRAATGLKQSWQGAETEQTWDWNRADTGPKGWNRADIFEEQSDELFTLGHIQQLLWKNA